VSLPTLRCQTYTRLWVFGRYTYTVVGHRLWLPISHRALGYGAALIAPLWLLLWVAHVPFSAFGLTLHFVLPVVLVRWALSMAGNGERPLELALSWLRLGWYVARHRPRRAVAVRDHARVAGLVPVRVRER
jgi:hypothetical protein